MGCCANDDDDDDWWRNHPKYAEQFTDKINCVQLHLVGHLLISMHSVNSL